MQQRVSLITLGVRDMDGAAAFYASMGWQQVDTQDGVVVFDLIGQALGLYPIEKLAEDIGISVDDMGRGAATLGYNCREKSEVAEVLAAARAAGATILKEAADVFWGGHHGYFSDPEGHIWEVAHNPFSPLSAENDAMNGAFRWNGYT